MAESISRTASRPTPRCDHEHAGTTRYDPHVPTWTEDIAAALEALGGAGSYEEIYAEVAARRSNLPASWQATIRGAIETASSDSQAFRGGKNLFRSVEGIGRGVWGLRTTSAEQAVFEGPGVAQNPGSVQGYVADSVVRKAIEEHALDLAESHYGSRATGAIERIGKPYDLRVPVADGEIHVEVKGSTRNLGAVFLTKNEVAHARATVGTELFVVDRIKLTTDHAGKPSLAGGRRRRWTAWVPATDALTPEVFSYALPEAGGGD